MGHDHENRRGGLDLLVAADRLARFSLLGQSELRTPAGAAQDAAGQCSGHPTLVQHHFPIHQYVLDARAVAPRFVERRAIAHEIGIEDHDIGVEAGAQEPAVAKRHVLRGERAHLADRFLETEEPRLTDVPAEDARERSIRARVWRPARKRTVGAQTAVIRRDAHPGLHQRDLHVLLARHEEDGRRTRRIGHEEIEERVQGILPPDLRQRRQAQARVRLEVGSVDAGDEHPLGAPRHPAEVVPVGPGLGDLAAQPRAGGGIAQPFEQRLAPTRVRPGR
jgi:hypothetical protein